MLTDEGKVAIVTGAASGIGRAIARRLAAEGAAVVVADMQEEGGQAVANEIRGAFVRTDLARRQDCQELVHKTAELYGAVHILVNNAGFQHIDPIEQFPEDEWDRMISLMLTAPFLLTRYAWPYMMAQEWGRVINISSVAGLRGHPHKSAYVAVKHGLIGLTRVTALEGGPHGITAHAVCPTWVRTPLLENQIPDQIRTRGIGAQEVMEQVMLAPIAIKRLVEPEEVAGLVAFLCSEEASAMTGSPVLIDGGVTAG